MATITVRQLGDEVVDQLKLRAASNRRSMEAEVREILSEATKPKQEEKNLLQLLDEALHGFEGIDLTEQRSENLRWAEFQ